MDRQKPIYSLPIDNYQGGEDFAQWVRRLEMAVSLTYSLDDPEKKEQRDGFCLQWLPLKLDEATYVVYENVKGRTWEEIKVELTALLEDPQERYDFFANRNPIIWDGKESFHSLASRIRQKVNKFVSDESRPREYFHRFRAALPLEYRQAIDLRCGDEWEIDKAMEIAGRLRWGGRRYCCCTYGSASHGGLHGG